MRYFFYMFIMMQSVFIQTYATPLQDYIAQEDPHYSWNIIQTLHNANTSTYIINLCSQKWRSEKEVSPSLWKHWLYIVVPKKIESTTTLLFIEGGNHSPTPSLNHLEHLRKVAKKTHSVTASITMIPNQSLHFKDEKDPRYIKTGRREDSLIAYAWDKFLTTQDPIWLP